MSATSRTTLRHVPALDGLRGLAVLGVLLFHANGALRGGYLGVDLFFVLSGFLITSLLLAEHRATGTLSLSSFWLRRATRLFPALLSLMPAVAAYAVLLAGRDELHGLRTDALATLAYVANWHTIFAEKSYWELFAAPSLLEHTWSLAIEEQFYVVWPLVVLGLLRVRHRRALLVATVGLCIFSVAAMVALYDPLRTSRVYLGTDARASGILAGAAWACVVSPTTVFTPRTVRLLDGIGLVAAAGLGMAWCRLEGTGWFLYHGGFWLTELAALTLIACAMAGPTSLVARALAFRPLTAIGTISYGVYLWHWPVDVVMTPERVHLHGIALHGVRFAVTFAVAIASYRVLEHPIRTRGIRGVRALIVFGAAFALAAGLVILATRPPPLPVAPPRPNPRDVTHRVMVLGDSTASSLYWAMLALRKPDVDIALLTRDGCAMLDDNCDGEHWLQQARERHPDAILLIIAGAYLHFVRTDGVTRWACDPRWDRPFESHLAHRLADLGDEARHTWVTSVPYAGWRYEGPENRAQVDCINRSIRTAVASVPGVRILDLATYLCPHGVCTLEYAGAEIRNDGVHYRVPGAIGVARWMLDQSRH